MPDECSDVVENFFGVYLLYCKNPKYTGRTYIGYTVDPNRRIKQHNKGAQAGGARRTSNRGPWTMVMIVHGFPNEISALRFEWAWQHPTSSRRLRSIPKKRAKERVFDYQLRVLSAMLRTGPWCRLPLTIRWLDGGAPYRQDFPIGAQPPLHMPIVDGNVISKKRTQRTSQDVVSDLERDKDRNCKCCLCNEWIVDTLETNVKKTLMCVNDDCGMRAHLICLSRLWTKPGEYVPVEGQCPQCAGVFLWGDLIRKMRGCYRNCNLLIGSVLEHLSDDE